MKSPLRPFVVIGLLVLMFLAISDDADQVSAKTKEPAKWVVHEEPHPRGEQVTYYGMAWYLHHYGGFSGDLLVVMTATCMGESGGFASILGDTTITNRTWSASVGLCQVRSLRAQWGTGGARDQLNLVNPAHNAWAASEIHRVQGLRAWTVFRNGDYRRHLGQANTAALEVAAHPRLSEALGAEPPRHTTNKKRIRKFVKRKQAK